MTYEKNAFAFSQSVKDQSQLIANNYLFHTGQSLLNYQSEDELAQKLFLAPFVVLSHGTEADPLFNYANQKAMELWEMTWNEIVGLPSRQSAEPDAEEERQQFLKEAEQKGYVSNYQGIRISKYGKRFAIKNVFLMNLYNNNNQYAGQAAIFSEWEHL